MILNLGLDSIVEDGNRRLNYPWTRWNSKSWEQKTKLPWTIDGILRVGNRRLNYPWTIDGILRVGNRRLNYLGLGGIVKYGNRNLN